MAGRTLLVLVALAVAVAVAVAQPNDIAELAEAKLADDQVATLTQAGRYDDALPFAERSLAIKERLLGREHAHVGIVLNNLAYLYDRKRDFAQAEPRYVRAIAILEKARGPEHLALAGYLENLAALYTDHFRHRRAEAPYARALAIREKALGPDDVEVARSLNNLAGVYEAIGDRRRAAPLFERALAIYEKVLGPGDAQVGRMLNNIAAHHQENGDYARAEPLFERALGILEKSVGARHEMAVGTLANLAALADDRGDYARAETLYRRAITLADSDDLTTAAMIDGLALTYYNQRDFARAAPLFERALAMRERLRGPDHPAVATSLGNLASLYDTRGDHERARSLQQRALAIRETYDRDGPAVATSLNNLAGLVFRDRYYVRAEAMYRRALAIIELAYGDDHPDAAAVADNLATVFEARGELAHAVQWQARANDARERFVAKVLAAGSEAEKRAFLATSASVTDASISLAVRSGRADAARVAATVILRRKGRALDATASSVLVMRRRLDAEGQRLLDELADLRDEIAKRSFDAGDDPQSRRKLLDLARRTNELERAISAKSATFRVAAESIMLAAVQRAIPERAALVEWMRYRHFDAFAKPMERYGDTRYAAVVIRRAGDPTVIDLGDATAIDAAVASARGVLADPSRDPARALRELHTRALAPVRARLGETRWLLLSPDGALNLVPFAALLDDDGRFLAERWALTYVTSGRDLLRFSAESRPRGASLVVANPQYGAATVPARAGATELAGAVFEPLPETAVEGQTIADRLTGATLATGDAATEAALRAARGPRVLHVATHGFFLGDDERAARPDARALQIVTMRRPVANANPLLRSGLALAGANARRSGERDDGILTALEAASLDLDGTQLVVLSACDTGVGEVRGGDGVYGLRRALALAGAETQVMSLWKVDDAATRRLMIAYYDRLVRGAGRADAMQDVQREMLADGATRHPYFWASFVVTGNPASLDGRLATPRLAQPPAQRGCACSGGGSPPEHLAFVVFVCLVWRAKRSRRHRTIRPH